ATLPEYRNCGIMGEMIEYALNNLKMCGYQAVYLYPADEHLYDYYHKFGFENKFFCRVYEPDSTFLDKYKNQRYFLSDHSYAEMRQHLVAENFAQFDSNYLDFAHFCAVSGGFEINAVFDDEDKVFITGHYENNVMYIDEAFSSECNYEHIFGLLADRKYKKIVIKTPVEIELKDLSSRVVNDGMLNIFTDDDKIYYLGQPCM
ncbi:MAG: GNAT family N-acetyltransferase, partial [Clostridia bacterium]|nr:GNAT family N-acetyltransferase [Clostridia bacterium]